MSPRLVSYLVSFAASALMLGGIAWATFGLHGVITEHASPGPPPATGLGLFLRIIVANVGAVAMAATGIATAGVGSLLLAPVVAANLSILFATGQVWLTHEQFTRGLAIHGGGEVVAVLLGCAAGLHPAMRVLTAPAEHRRDVGRVRLYVGGIAETVPLLVLAVVVILAAAAWEVLVSLPLV